MDSGGATIEDITVVVVEYPKNRNQHQGHCRKEHGQCYTMTVSIINSP